MYTFITGCSKSFFLNILITDNFIVTNICTFVARDYYINGEKAVISA